MYTYMYVTAINKKGCKFESKEGYMGEFPRRKFV